MGTLPYRLSVNHPFDGCYDYGRKAIFFITKINIAFRDILATLIYMKNILNDKDFFEQNLIHMNRVTGKVIAYGNLAPVLLAGGIFLKLYEMPLQWLIIFSCFLIPFTIVQNILTRKCKNQKAIAYFDEHAVVKFSFTKFIASSFVSPETLMPLIYTPL